MRKHLFATHALVAGSLLLAPRPARGQAPAPSHAPLNPAYTLWLIHHTPRGMPGPLGGGKEGGTRVRGHLPHPVDLSHVKGPVFSAGAGGVSYPPSFDLRSRGLLTPVKDQGPFGTCWSFAAIGSLESSLLKAGIGCFDLSEWHLAYYAYVPFNASLLTAFTSGSDGEDEDPVFDQGGNDFMSTAILARGTGPVLEKDCPYQTGPYLPGPRPGGALPNGKENLAVPLEHALYLFESDSPAAAGDVKYALTNLGPVVISIDWEDANYDAAQYTYRDTTATEAVLNHEVCIVGWDDTFPRKSFPASSRPKADGAWLVRNSWSAAWGDAGYFHLSYDSKLFEGSVFLGGHRTTRKLHQYDPLGWCGSLGFGATSAYMANSFSTEGPETVTAVAFYAGASNTAYELQVLPANGGLPDFAQGGGQKGTLQAPGFHTVELDQPLVIAPGCGFLVQVKLTTPGYAYPIPVQEVQTGYSEGSTAFTGRSFISPDGKTWQDLAAGCSGTSLCLKALTE